MGKPSAPRAPDPVATANAQTASNRQTAIAQAQLNAVDQRTPLGNLTYTQERWPDGTPKFTATQTLTPQAAAIQETGLQTQQNLANLAQTQSGRLDQLLAEPFSLNNDAVEGRLMELGNARLAPQLAQRREAEIARLANQGIRGGKVYDDAMTRLEQSENDALNQLLLNGRAQSVNELLTERTQPLNEILALAGQGQVGQPQFMSTPQTQVAGTDVAGINNAAYQGQLSAYNSQQQGFNQMLGGLFSAGAALLPLSDRRAKTDIRRIGTADNGLPIYAYRLKGDPNMHIGFMADEVQQLHPNAVILAGDGFYHVDYAKAVEAA